MQPRVLTKSQLTWTHRLNRFGGMFLRTGLLLIGAAGGVAAIGAYESQLLSDWPILAFAHGVFEYRYSVVPLALVGAVLLGFGLVHRFGGGERNGQ